MKNGIGLAAAPGDAPAGLAGARRSRPCGSRRARRSSSTAGSTTRLAARGAPRRSRRSPPGDEVEARVRTEARFAYDGTRSTWRSAPATRTRANCARPSRAATSVLADQDMVVLFIDPVGNAQVRALLPRQSARRHRRRPLQRGHRQRGLLAGLRVRRGHGALRRRLDGGIPHPVLVAALQRPAERRVERARLPQLPARPALPHGLQPAAARRRTASSA